MEDRLFGVRIRFLRSPAEYQALHTEGNVFLKPLVTLGHFLVQAMHVEADITKGSFFDQSYVMATVRAKRGSLAFDFSEPGSLGTVVMQAMEKDASLATALGLDDTLETLSSVDYKPRSSTQALGYWVNRPVLSFLQDVGSFDRLAAYAAFMTQYRAEDVIRLAAEFVSARPGPIPPGPVWPHNTTETMLRNHFGLRVGTEDLEHGIKAFVGGQVSLQHLLITGDKKAPNNVVRIASMTSVLQPARRYVMPPDDDVEAAVALRMLQDHEGEATYNGVLFSSLRSFVASHGPYHEFSVSRLPPEFRDFYDRLAVQTFLALLGYKPVEGADWVVDISVISLVYDRGTLDLLNGAIVDACVLVNKLKPRAIKFHDALAPNDPIFQFPSVQV